MNGRVVLGRSGVVRTAWTARRWCQSGNDARGKGVGIPQIPTAVNGVERVPVFISDPEWMEDKIMVEIDKLSSRMKSKVRSAGGGIADVQGGMNYVWVRRETVSPPGQGLTVTMPRENDEES